MKKCDYCDGLGVTNTPLEKFTNEEGWTECYRHKDLRNCIWQFRFELDQSRFKWAVLKLGKWVSKKVSHLVGY